MQSIRHMNAAPMSVIAGALSVAAFAAPQASTEPASNRAPIPERVREDPRYGLLTPLPETGGIPAIYDLMHGPREAELAHRAQVREYEMQFRLLKRHYFRSVRNPETVQQGLDELAEFTDPASFQPMLEVFADAPEPVRLAVFDHLAAQGDWGLAAIAWSIVHLSDPDDPVEQAVSNEATMLLEQRLHERPTPQPVLQVLDSSLRSPVHKLANNAGALAGAINAVETIPLLIFAQATSDDVNEQTGDLAWIAIQTQQAYVANVQPVVGDDSGAFQPVLGVVSEGVVLRVMDAVAINYRTYIHRSLVAMTTHEWGRSTEHLGYDMKAWWHWYNSEYVPFRNEQIAMTRLAEQNQQAADPPSSPPTDGSDP